MARFLVVIKFDLLCFCTLQTTGISLILSLTHTLDLLIQMVHQKLYGIIVGFRELRDEFDELVNLGIAMSHT